MAGTLSIARVSKICDAVVTNLTGSALTLKDGILLIFFKKLNDELLLDEASNAVPDVTECDAVTTLDSTDKLSSPLVLQDYLQAKPRLLDLLRKYRTTVALSKENFRFTHTAKHGLISLVCP